MVETGKKKNNYRKRTGNLMHLPDRVAVDVADGSTGVGIVVAGIGVDDVGAVETAGLCDGRDACCVVLPSKVAVLGSESRNAGFRRSMLTVSCFPLRRMV